MASYCSEVLSGSILTVTPLPSSGHSKSDDTQVLDDPGGFHKQVNSCADQGKNWACKLREKSKFQAMKIKIFYL